MREKFTIYLEEVYKKEIKFIALEKNCSASDIMNDLVQEYLNSLKSGNVNIDDLISNLFEKLEQGNISLESCKKEILDEFQKLKNCNTKF